MNDPKTLEEAMNALPKADMIKRLEKLLNDLYEDKASQRTRFVQAERDKQTHEAREEYQPLIEEYYQCIKRLNEIGNTKAIQGDFNLNDYIDFNGVRASMKSNLHMAKVGLERINKNTRRCDDGQKKINP